MADSTPRVDVIEVRGEKRVAFEGLEYLDLSSDQEADILDRYEELLITLDDLADSHDGVDRAWHIGKSLVKYDVGQDTEITLADVAKYNSIDVDERRMTYYRNVYRFFPDRSYDDHHNVTALGELASRSRGLGLEAEAKEGYRRIREAGVDLTRNDIFAWYDLAEADAGRTLDAIAGAVAEYYDTPQNMVNSIQRVSLLVEFDLQSKSRDRIVSAVRDHVDTN
jgi:hypothetical protein